MLELNPLQLKYDMGSGDNGILENHFLVSN